SRRICADSVAPRHLKEQSSSFSIYLTTSVPRFWSSSLYQNRSPALIVVRCGTNVIPSFRPADGLNFVGLGFTISARSVACSALLMNSAARAAWSEGLNLSILLGV